MIGRTDTSRSPACSPASATSLSAASRPDPSSAAGLLAACARQTAQDLAEASTGKVIKVIPVTIESDTAPHIGQILTPKTANRPGWRIQVLNYNNKLIEVTQDDGGFKPGEIVRIEGYGSNAKIRRQ